MNSDDAWMFALRFYSRPGVSEILVRMQDAEGISVPFLLVLLAATKANIEVDEVEFDPVMSKAERWQHEVIDPLRKARRALQSQTSHAETLYNDVKRIELAAEEAAIKSIAASVATPASTGSPRHLATTNLDRYRLALGLPVVYFDALWLAFRDALYLEER